MIQCASRPAGCISGDHLLAWRCGRHAYAVIHFGVLLVLSLKLRNEGAQAWLVLLQRNTVCFQEDRRLLDYSADVGNGRCNAVLNAMEPAVSEYGDKVHQRPLLLGGAVIKGTATGTRMIRA